MLRYEIRAAGVMDHAEILELAQYLNSVNLPHDSDALHEILRLSEQSFSEAIGDPRKREYLFVLRDNVEQRVIGTSMVLGQLGRKDAPYIYFDVHKEEKYSATLDKHFVHTILSIGYSFHGPSEIGALVLHPDYRGAPEHLGTMISYVRFLWMAMHRADFQDVTLAELLPPLEADGTSHLWEAIGRHFTGLTYREADRLSKSNKEFIRTLFPDADIYAPLLSAEAQAVLGKVGPQTQGVEKMLRKVGFEYVDRIDPFDGGPHFTCDTDKISAVRSSRQKKVRGVEASPEGFLSFLALEYDSPPYFRAVMAPCTLHETEVLVSTAVLETLGAKEGEEIWVLPLDT